MKKLKISQVSSFFANGSYPIEFLFYYPKGVKTKKLQRALRKISKNFWTVFGSYNKGIITENKFIESNYFEETILDESFDPEMAQEEMYYKFGSRIPKKISNLFYLKVLQYTNGTVFVIKMNHLVGDGYSFFYLLSVLALTTKRANIPLLPMILRAFSKPKFDSNLHNDFHLKEQIPEFQTNFDDLEVKVTQINQNNIRKIGHELSEKIGKRISTNDLLCAQMLKMILENKAQKSDLLTLVIPVDMRRGVSELGQRFFGNGLILYRVSFTIDEVTKKNVKELAIRIRENFPNRTTQTYVDYLEMISSWISEGKLENLMLYDPDTEFLVTNLSRMPIPRLDFGTGSPDKIVPLTRGKSGAAILAQDENFILQLGT